MKSRNDEKIYTRVSYKQELVNTVTVEQYVVPEWFKTDDSEEYINVNGLTPDNIVSKSIISLEEYKKQKENENE
jgi:hypothetical protein